MSVQRKQQKPQGGGRQRPEQQQQQQPNQKRAPEYDEPEGDAGESGHSTGGSHTVPDPNTRGA